MYLVDYSFTPTTILVYIFGFLALVPFVLSFQAKNRKYLLILQIVSLLLFSVQYLLLGAWTGLILEFICIVRNIMFYFRDRVKSFNNIAMPIFFSLAAIAVGVFTRTAWYWFIPVLANISQTIGLYMRKDINNRIFFLIGSPLWLVYNCLTGALVGVVTEVCNIISIVISIVRLAKNNKKVIKPEPKHIGA